MMKLSTMSDIVYACSNQNENLLTDSIIKLWFSNHGPVEFVRISANCVFRFEAEGNTFFLRFNSDHECKVEQLEEEIRFVDYLARNGVYVSEPMPSLNGLCVRSIESAIGLLHASVFRALPGQICHKIGELTPEMLTAWGYALGNLHHKSQNYTNCMKRHSWQEHLKLIEEYLPKEEYTAWRQLEQVKQKLNCLPTDDGVFGLIHYDFELDNIIWDSNIPGIIDFDDCAFYWYAADIAFTLRDLFDDRADRVNINVDAYQLLFKVTKLQGISIWMI